MDEHSESNHSQPGTPQASISRAPGSNLSGLTLVLPALKGGKPIKGAKSKHKTRLGLSSGVQDAGVEEQKVVRPVKLKPLKEVLTKLIAQIKKKDDYAFFLKPVDPSKVSGYSDVIKRPMDLGTMTIKVARGRYRSLDDFTADFRLVTGNAKLFNPPGTIYHTEADRIEAWGIDHISKSASTVIQYETDWNIEIEKDDEGHTVNIDDDDDYYADTPMDVDGPMGRSPSVTSQVQPGTSRRGLRGPYKKSTTNSNKLSESIDVDGRLPGSKDGLGVFPPGSTWAETMLALKLKGKRYRTKKEKVRVEKEGPPYRTDGSLDYTEMEDPFSILSVFVPDPPSRPYLTPLYPPTYVSTTQPQVKPDPPHFLWQSDSPSQSQTQASTPQPSAPFPTPVNIPLHLNRPPLQSTIPATATSSGSKRRRHWIITRNAPTRGKVKDKDDDDTTGTYTLPWDTPREAHAVDFGSFALLAGELAEEMKVRGIKMGDAGAGEEEERVFDAIRVSLDCEAAGKKLHTGGLEAKSAVFNDANAGRDGYWTTQRAAEAEEYIRDVVYGGVDGLAYVRSLAEFVSRPQLEDPAPTSIGDPGADSSPGSGLGRPISKWVEQTIVDPLTEGRHKLLRETAFHLSSHLTSTPFIQNLPSVPNNSSTTPESNLPHRHETDGQANKISAQVATSLYISPAATQALSTLLQIRTHKIDMGALIHTPAELFLSEEEWAGKAFKEQLRTQSQSQKEKKNIIQGAEGETEEPDRNWMDVDAIEGVGNKVESGYELEGPEEMNHVLDYVAGVIIDLDRNIREGRGLGSMMGDEKSTMERNLGAEGTGDDDMNMMKEEMAEAEAESLSEPSSRPEDPVLRNLRLNLLALAKRAPLDTIARLPKDLVPEHIRHFVPTLGTSK